MNALWQRYCDWFDARQPREKWILVFGVLAALALLGFQQWVDPALSEAGRLAGQTQRDRDNAQALLTQQAALEQQIGSANAAQMANLARLRRSFDEQEPQIQAVQKALVPAKDMAVFLQSLLKGNKGLQWLSLETLPPEALAGADDDGKKKSAADVHLYKHGVRLRLSGSYRELTAYLEELERAPQRVLWGDMKLSVKEHPRVELSLTVYTLSLDKAWMTL